MSLKKSIKNVGLLIAVIFILSGVVQAATITVPDDYAKIQWAVDNASSGDTIEVRSGTYYENVNVTKQLILQGMDTGEGKPVVNAEGSGDVIALNADDITLNGFTVINATSIPYSGIKVISSNNTISNNIASNNVNGILLISSNNNTIFNNDASLNSRWGIFLSSSSSNNTLNNNTANSNNWYGISLWESSNYNSLTNNIITNNAGSGIYLSSFSCYNTFRDNTASSNSGDGIRLASYSNYNTITNNTASDNSWGGITLSDSSNNILKNNTANNNGDYGIKIGASSNNIIYNNNFNNIINIFFGGTIYSNSYNTTKILGINIIGGPYLGGNFWANPNGTGFSQTCADADGDGICDTGYILNAQNIDYLPLSLNFTTATTPLSSIGYSALVATGQNTFVESSSGSFGLLLKGETETISNSVVLNNTGDLSAKVEARFNDSISGVFGLISGANVLNATNFALGQSGSLVPLDNNGADLQIVVAPLGVTALDARLGVPSEQMAGDYSGTVVLTFSNDV